MKIANFVAISEFFLPIIPVLLISACGSSTPASVGLPLTSGPIYNDIACATSASTGSIISQSPLYNGSQLIGYEETLAAGGASYNNGYSLSVLENVPVCAGDTVLVSGSGATYGIVSAYCGSGFFTGYIYPTNTGTISNIAVTLNGQALTAASTTVSQNGSMTISGTYTALSPSCSGNNITLSGTATNIDYYVNLSNSVTIQRCVDPNQNPMVCPN